MARAWLKQLRVEKSFTQAALASAAGIKVARYSRIEAGYCEFRDEEATALAETLKETSEFIRSGKRILKTKGSELGVTKAKTEATAVASQPSIAPSSPAISPKGLSVAKTSEPSPTGKVGDDLSDPVNFSLMPPTEALTCGSLAPAEFRNRLQQHIAFATKILHTSKVKPRIWVAWRDFNKEAQNLLRGSEPAPKTSTDHQPAPISNEAPPPKPDTPASGNPQARRTRGNRNLFGYFVEVAKESLPAEKMASLSELATTAKNQQPELGFMKHFKLIAEAELSPADFGRIAAEAAQRHSS